MSRFFLLFFLSAPLYFYNNLYAAGLRDVEQDVSGMSCNELMLGLIKTSSFNKTFVDKKMMLVFGFERYSNNIIMLVFIRTKGIDKGGVYVNLELNLVDYKLTNIDPDPSVPLKINNKYVPYIADKCTPDKNIRVYKGKLPDEEDGNNLDDNID